MATNMGRASDRRPHAVAIPFPAQGHVAPMMHLCTKLAAQGFIITFVNTPHNQARLEHMQNVLAEQGLDVRLVEIKAKNDHGSTSGQENLLELVRYFRSLRDVLEELVRNLLLQDPPITCMISDLYNFFTQEIATKLGLRRLCLWTASAGVLASVMAVKQGYRNSKEPTTLNPDKLITWVPGVPPLRLTELHTFLQSFDPQDFMFDGILRSYSSVNEATWIAFNTFEELEHESLAALRKEHDNIYTVGPLLPTSYFHGSVDPQYRTAALWQEDYDCLEWLDKQQTASVLYISFGSIAIFTLQQFEELALGLEACGQPLLWVIRSDLMSGEYAMLPEGYLDRMKDRACLVSWAPQLQVLTHPATGGFLTHFGWNSTLESLSAGVPMLGWPYFADQMQNMRCAVDGWKVGLEFEGGKDITGVIGREEVERKARALMQGESRKELRETAKKWKMAAAKAMVEEGSSFRNWHHLVDAMAQLPTPS